MTALLKRANFFQTPRLLTEFAEKVTLLCRLTADLLEEQGVPLSEAKEQLLKTMPQGCVLLSYGIDNDLEWLGLQGKRDRGVSCSLMLHRPE